MLFDILCALFRNSYPGHQCTLSSHFRCLCAFVLEMCDIYGSNDDAARREISVRKSVQRSGNRFVHFSVRSFLSEQLDTRYVVG